MKRVLESIRLSVHSLAWEGALFDDLRRLEKRAVGPDPVLVFWFLACFPWSF